MKTNLIKSLFLGFSLLLFIFPSISYAQFNPTKILRGPDPTTVTTNFVDIKYVAHLNGANTVKWSFSDLSKLASFTVMVSEDDSNYSDYKDISNTPTSNISKVFTAYLDDFNGSSRFIRLRANYGDGTFEDSESREVLFYGSKKTEISTWPNPVMEEVQIGDISELVTDLIIYDQHGSIKRTEGINPYQESKSLNIASFKTGFYHFILLDENGRIVQSKRIFKQ